MAKMTSFNRWKTRRWICGDRHYTACLQQDLFGSWCIIKAWGSCSSARGRSQTVNVCSYSDGLQLMDAIAGRREKRLYREVAA